MHSVDRCWGTTNRNALGTVPTAHSPLNIRNKRMKTNNDLFSIVEVCTYFGLSESTIRRKVRDSRDGVGNFPLPLFGSKCRVLWRKSDIESWRGEDADTIIFSPSQVSPAPQVAPLKSNAQVHRELKALGVKLPE